MLIPQNANTQKAFELNHARLFKESGKNRKHKIQKWNFKFENII